MKEYKKMKDLRIIPVTNEELVFSLTAVADDIWREYYTPLLGKDQVDYMLEKFFSPEALVEQINGGCEYFLFSHEYTFAGFAAVKEEDKDLFLSKLYVHSDFRGKKIASHMFAKFIELCKLRGLNRIYLTCNRNNTDSLAVYEHWGFKKIREEKADIGQGYYMDDYILEYYV